MSITSNLDKINKTLASGVKLIAVSKFHPASSIQEAYDAGQRIFGESKMQELSAKFALLPADIQWHFIGHLQTNKVKSIIPYTHTIHSVDSEKLLWEIEKQATALGKSINCLIEVHIAQEDSKYGFSFDECRAFFEALSKKELKSVKIAGLMGMSTNTEDEIQIHKEFKDLRLFFDEIKNRFFKDKSSFSELSMGMSNDYLIAMQEGSTMVRIGSSIFGERQ